MHHRLPDDGAGVVTDRRNVWTEAADADLRRLWADGATTGTIAAHFRTTRNAVIGRVHRLHLPPRPSPIPGHVPKRDILPAKRDIGVTRRDIMAPAPLPTPPRMPGVSRCQYPFGHPREPGFHYCGEPVWRGVYCRVCFARCYLQHRIAA
jgi:GcrA cell cycle regulator